MITKLGRKGSAARSAFDQMRTSAGAPGGKAVSRQILEMAKLRFGPTKLWPGDYLWLNLADGGAYADADLSEFAGNSMRVRLNARLNSPRWDAVVTDKLMMSLAFESLRVPQPELYGAACRFARSAGDHPVLRDHGQLREFLADTIPYPFFCKPIKGGSAAGAQRVESYDPESATLGLATGEKKSIDQFIESLVDPSGWGYLFQEAVIPHPATADICGDAVSGCRVVVLLDDDDARMFRVAWKVPAPGQYVDNYHNGDGGNSLADIDLDSGRVRRAVTGVGTDLRIDHDHAGTGIELVGRPLPCWEELCELVPRLAMSFPGFRFQHWDIGLTSKGPIPFELNTAGTINFLELCSGSGIMDSTLLAFMAKHEPEGRRRTYRGMPPVSSS